MLTELCSCCRTSVALQRFFEVGVDDLGSWCLAAMSMLARITLCLSQAF